MNNKTKVLILVGIAGSGKSTWAKEQVKSGQGKWKRVNKDSLREMLDCKEYTKENEKIIEGIRDDIIWKCLVHDINIIVDDTNLSERHHSRIAQLVKDYNSHINFLSSNAYNKAEIEIKYFPITLDEALYRNNTRPKEEKIPEKTLCEMYRKYVKIGGPLPFNSPVYNPDLPDCIICDLDGTLADFSLNRGPFEQEKCADDKCVEPVAQAIFAQHRLGTKIIIISGRHNTYRQQTIDFLEKNSIDYDLLLMRREEDNRGDEIIKEEIYHKYIKNKYNVLFVLDDRLKVIRKWKQLGLFVFNVGNSIDF